MTTMMPKTDNVCGLKSKFSIEEEGSMYFVFSSTWSPKAVALFECKLAHTNIDTTTKDDNLKDHEVDIFTGDLTEIKTFYDQTISRRMMHVACCPFGDVFGNYVIFPNDFSLTPLVGADPDVHDTPREYPFLLNLLADNSNDLAKEFDPLTGPKEYPLAVPMYDNKIYVLSRRKCLLSTLVPPSFEAYDMVSKACETLPAPWFNENNPTDVYWSWTTTGYAVFENFIIFCLWNLVHSLAQNAICSFDIISKKWKPVAYAIKTRVTVRDESGRVFNTNNDGEVYLYGFNQWKKSEFTQR